MATIVDSLIVTLGLDSKDFEKGQKKTQDAFDKTRKDADKTAKDLEHAGKQAAQFFSKMRNEALAFFAVLAVGSGLKNFVENTIASASGLDRLSANLGMSAKDLSEWQLAAKHAGGTAEGMTTQIRSAADDVAKFKMGFGSETLKAFFQMGGSTDDLRNANTLLLKKADIIKKIYDVDPNKARVVAAMLGVTGDGEFSFMKQGSAEVERQRKAQAGLAEEMARASKPAEELRKKFDSLKNTFESISVNVLNSLMPVFDRMLVYFREIGDWVAGHKEQISEWVDKAVTAIIEFVKRLNEGVEAVGGWKNVLVALLALKVLSFTANLVGMAVALGRVGAGLGLIGTLGAGALKILGPLGLLLHSEGAGTGEDEALALRNGVKGPGSAGGSLSSRQQYLLSRLKMDGFSDAQAAGIAGSLMQESGLNPNALNAKSGAAGIGQWLGSRKKGFADRYGHGLDKSSFEEQVDYMLWEMRNTEKHSGDLLRRASSPQIAAQIHAWEYERPGVNEANIGKRQSYAESLFASIGQGNAMAAANLPTSAGMPTMRYGGSPNSTVSSETHIGQITIQTAATDANGIAKDAQSAFQRYAFSSQSNTGLN